MVVHHIKLFKTILSAVVFIAFYELNFVTLLSFQNLKQDNLPDVVIKPIPVLSWNPLGEVPFNNRTDRIIFGLPSVLRSNGNSYLIAMLKSAIAGMSDEEKAIHKFVILNAETEIEKQNYLASNITQVFQSEMDSGLITIIVPPRQLYEPLDKPCKLQRNFNDSLARVIWRSKQALDTAYLIEYCKELGKHYVHLEDDITFTPGHWLEEMRSLSTKVEDSADWGASLFFSQGRHKSITRYNLNVTTFGGMIAIYTRTDLLDGFPRYAYQHFDEEPVDWLYGHYLLSEGKTLYWLKNLVIHGGRSSTKDFVLRHEKKKTTPEEALNTPTWEKCAL